MTRKQHVLHLVIQLLSLLIASLSGLMAMDAQIHPILALSPKLTYWWPAVLIVSALLSRMSNAILSLIAIFWPEQK